MNLLIYLAIHKETYQINEILICELVKINNINIFEHRIQQQKQLLKTKI